MPVLDAIFAHRSFNLSGRSLGKCGGIVKNCEETRTRASGITGPGWFRGGPMGPPLHGLLLLLGLLGWRLAFGLVCGQIFARSHIGSVGHARDLATGGVVDADA